MKTESVIEFLKRGGTIKTIPAEDRPTELTADYTEKAQEAFFEQNTDFIDEINPGNDLSEIISIDRVLSRNEYKARKPSWKKIWKFDSNR